MSTETPILVAERKRGRAAEPSVRPAPWPFIMGSGLVLAFIGWVDVLLLWYPTRFGDAEWEFGTASATFDALPLATIGLIALAVAVRISGGAGARRAVAGLAILAVIGFMAAYLLFALSFLQGLGNVPAEANWILVRAGAKATIFAFAYSGLYIWLSFMLLRSPKS